MPPPSGDSGYEEVLSLVVDVAAFNRDVADVYNTFKRNSENITRELQVTTDQGIKFYANMQKAAANAVKTMFGDIKSTKETLNKSLQEIADREDAQRKQAYKDESARLRQSVSEKVAAIEASQARIAALNKAVAADISRVSIAEIRKEELARDQAVKKSLRLIQDRREAEARAHRMQMQEVREYIAAEGAAAAAAIAATAAAQRQARSRVGAAAQVASHMGIPGSGMLSNMAYASSNAAGAAGGMSAGAMAAVAGVTALVGAVGAMIKAGSDLEDSLASMSTLMQGAGQNTATFRANLEMLTEQAAVLSVKFNKDINEVVRGFKEALSAGIDEADVAKFADASGTLANAIGTDIQSTTNVLTTFKDAYGLTIDELTAVNNQLFKAIDVGKISVTQLNSSIGKLIPTAATAGISITDMLSGVAALSRIMPTNQAITSLNKLIEDIVHPSDKAAKAFKELGIETGQAQFQIKGLGGVLSELASKSGGKLDVLGQLFPEQRGLRAAGGLSKMLDLFKEINKEIGGSADSMIALEAAIVATDTASNKMGRAWKGIWNDLTIGANDFIEAVSKIGLALSGDDAAFEEMMFGDRGMKEQARFVAEAVAAEKAKQNAVAAERQKAAAEQTAGFDQIGASVEAIHPHLQKSIDAVKKFNDQLFELGDSDKWRFQVVQNFDKMTAEIIARMEARKAEIVKVSQEMFLAYGGDPADYAKNSQKAVDEANSDDSQLLDSILKQREAAASPSVLKSQWSEFVGKITEEGKKILKSVTDLGKKIMDEKAEIAKRAFSEFDKLYKKDTELYEAAEKKKAAIQEKYSDKIKKIEEDRIQSINKLHDLTKSWEFDQHRGDPNSMARTARRQREQSTNELRDYVGNGGSDERHIQMLRDDIIKALTMEHDNSDNTRSSKWTAIQAEIEDLLLKAFGNTTKASKEKEKKELASANYNRMSPEEMAKLAADKANQKQEDKQIVNQDLQINLTVTANGLVDDKGLNYLTSTLIKRIATAQKNSTDRTNQPRSGYPDRTSSDAE